MDKLPRISREMRDVLIEHVDGPLAIHMVADCLSRRRFTMKALVGKGWVRYDRPHHPRMTSLTEEGREVLAAVLADYAEALVRAGALEPGIGSVDTTAIVRHPASEKHRKRHFGLPRG